jgi:hydrogenase expression/formation protein HypC
MCLAVPSKVIRIDDMMATVDVYGARRDINLMLMPEPVELGDYVLVHAGFAIQKVDEEAAREALKAIHEMAEILAEAEEDEAECGYPPSDQTGGYPQFGEGKDPPG